MIGEKGIHWDHFWSTLGPFWEYIGTILGINWDHFWSTLGPFWEYIGTILGPFWSWPVMSAAACLMLYGPSRNYSENPEVKKYQE